MAVFKCRKPFIEAVQLNKGNFDEIHEFCKADYMMWYVNENGDFIMNLYFNEFYITVPIGSYLLRVDGNLISLSEMAFEKQFERV